MADPSPSGEDNTYTPKLEEEASPAVESSSKDVEEAALEDVNLADDVAADNVSASSSSEELKKSVETDSSAGSLESPSKRGRTQASGFAQILAIIRKNLLSKMRSPGATFFEVFSPVIMMLILAAAYTLSEITDEPEGIYVNPVINFPGPFLDIIQRSAGLFGGEFDLTSALGRRRNRKLGENNLLQSMSEKKPSSWEGVFHGLEQKLESAMKGHAKNIASGTLDEGYERSLQQVRNRVDTSADEDAESYELLDDAEDEVCAQCLCGHAILQLSH